MRSGRTILFVDDELDSIDSFTENFRDDYEVAAVDDLNVMQTINQDTYDYVSLDIDMKIKDGIEVYRELRQVEQHSFVFVLTNLPPNHKKVEWFEDEGIRVFNKSDSKCADSIKAYMEQCTFHEPKDLSVLIIDDEKDKQETYGELLTEIGFATIEYCSSPEEAAQLVARKAFDIYLVDMCYGQGDGAVLRGAEVVSLLRQKDGNLACTVVPITGRYLARDSLKTIGGDHNLYPHFFDQPAHFIEKMRKILQRGPFKVRHA